MVMFLDEPSRRELNIAHPEIGPAMPRSPDEKQEVQVKSYGFAPAQGVTFQRMCSLVYLWRSGRARREKEDQKGVSFTSVRSLKACEAEMRRCTR